MKIFIYILNKKQRLKFYLNAFRVHISSMQQFMHNAFLFTSS